MPTFTGRVLFFHGYTQSSLIFYAKTSALRKKLIKLGYKCIYLQAPIKLTPADFPSNDALSKFNSVQVNDDEESNLRAWWVKPGNQNSNIDMTKAIDATREYIQDGKLIEDDDLKQVDDPSLPIVGLIGFSQGAGFIGLLLGKFNEMFKTNVKFAILYSGFALDTSKESGNEEFADYYKAKISNVKVLHVLGELDTVVSEERSTKLYDLQKDASTILKHPGGHFVPNSKVWVEKITNWIQTEKEDTKEEKDDLDDLLNMMDNIGK